MRSALIVAALAAGGANAYETLVYTTEWTTVTVTKTITASPVTVTVPAAQQVQVQESTSSSSSSTYMPVFSPINLAEVNAESSSSTATPTSVAAIAATTQAPAAAETEGTTSSFSTAWTSTWEAASTAEAAASTTSISSTGSSTATNAYQSAVLYHHNIHRANHSASDLEWDAALESSAAALANKCVYEHDTTIDGGGYGQNIGYGVQASVIGEMITNMMYNDEMEFYADLYGEANPDMTYFDNWGHFSQIVWKGSTKVGCATITCPSLGNVDAAEALPFTVCNYSPAGNFAGDYGTNVGKPLGRAMVVAS